ncbi:MAG: tRNA nucleotidyltransferase (CCA-adding enzyme) [Cellvibrionaceae bacterium]|jgi:tRNA nucleotidyltransferase (CCA-adding enzyme)
MKLGLILEKCLSKQANNMLKTVAHIATGLGQPTYLVGGAVRDVLLARSSNDLDFVTEGEGIALAQAVWEQLGGELTTHDRFGTAVWTPPIELFTFTIDFITARKETYSYPAALPDVIPSNMQDDLLRRDFTINAMAVRLDGNHFGQLLDLYDGQADLEKGKIRILHTQSFADDPTRIFRALRYSSRLSFVLSAETFEAIQQDLAKVNLLSADRLRHEFEKILDEPKPEPILEKLDKFRVLSQISTSLTWGNDAQSVFEKLNLNLETDLGQAALAESGLVHLRFLSWICTSTQPSQVATELTQKLNFSADMRHDLENVFQFTDRSAKLLDDLRPGTLEKTFRKLSATQLIVLQVMNTLPVSIYKAITTYFDQWQHIKTFTNGNTLRKMGLTPGPSYKIILESLLEAKLNGEITSELEETRLLKNLIKTFG